jgi:hypothetical protein
MKERKALSRETFQRYRRSDRGTKTKILDEFVESTQLNRKYALQMLKGTLRKHPPQVGARPRGRPAHYGQSVVVVLKTFVGDVRLHVRQAPCLCHKG